MRYCALACDYDGTLAEDGVVGGGVLEALERLAASGRRLVLLTGRRLDDLLQVFPRSDRFDRVVAENGAVLYAPATREEKVLAPPPPGELVCALEGRGVAPLAVGRAIVATWRPHEGTVLETIRDLGLELQVIFNKGAVMVLPSGVNKATGLEAALADLGLSPHNVVGVGDAENDQAFLRRCECAAAVANALPAVKQQVDLVLRGDRGAGVVELVEALLATDLAELAPRLARHEVLLGHREDGSEARIPPYGVNLLLAGSSGSGKSTLATALLERLVECGYQVCIVDPEGDYDEFEPAINLGSGKRAPLLEEVREVLERPQQSCVVNLLGLSLADRPAFFERLYTALQDLRARAGRPHWLVLDETHHLLPAGWVSGTGPAPKGLLLITVHPDRVAREVLASVDLIVAIGAAPADTIGRFSRTLGERSPPVRPGDLAPGEAVAWWRGRPEPLFQFRVAPPRGERRRHVRKYAEGELGEDKSFYFRGPEGKLNLRAQNLMLFVQLAEGMDDATWDYHLRRGDYARWFAQSIKDPELAREAERLARDDTTPPAESRSRLKALIEARYTAA